jgi:hypothetical protein
VWAARAGAGGEAAADAVAADSNVRQSRDNLTT